MNFAYIHLIINHIPMIGLPVALVFLTYGLWAKNHSSQRFSLLMIFAIAVLVLPVYFTGEPAEEVVEHLPGFTKSTIHEHEEAAEISLILTLVAGASSLAALWFGRDEKKGKNLALGVILITSVAVGSLGYTANLGGKIRHSEFNTGSATNLPANLQQEDNDRDDD